MFPDISEHQGAVDWSALGAAYQAGQIEAVSMRAGFGTVRTDLQFARNQSECRARGIPAIYYWFNYPTFNSPQAEAAMFNRTVGPLQPHEAMMGDFEDDPASNSVFPRGQAGIDWANAFLAALQAPTNAAWFYTYTSLFNAVGMGPLLATWPFVWADYSATPDSAFPAIARQFTDCGSTPGVVGCCDQNRVLKPPLSQWLTGGKTLTQSEKYAWVTIWAYAVCGANFTTEADINAWASKIADDGSNLYQVLTQFRSNTIPPRPNGRDGFNAPVTALEQEVSQLQISPVGRHTHSVTLPAEAAQTITSSQPQ
jgi:GH25 family lysozyme M1 (1,4-beta-N-acetylmuramidase)